MLKTISIIMIGAALIAAPAARADIAPYPHPHPHPTPPDPDPHNLPSLHSDGQGKGGSSQPPDQNTSPSQAEAPSSH